MTKEEVKKCFEYLQSLGLITSKNFGDNDSRFYTEDLDSVQWIARYEYLYKRFKVVSFIAVEDKYPHYIITYAAKPAETPYQLEVLVRTALTSLDSARKARNELLKKGKIKRIESAANEWST